MSKIITEQWRGSIQPGKVPTHDYFTIRPVVDVIKLFGGNLDSKLDCNYKYVIFRSMKFYVIDPKDLAY